MIDDVCFFYLQINDILIIKYLGCFNPFTQKITSSSITKPTSISYRFSYQEHFHLPVDFHKGL